MSLLEKIGSRPIVTCIVCLLFQNTALKAQMQVYPVSVTTRLIPPYSVNLADYAAPGCEQLKVIILQRDLTQSPYLLYLRMEIELNGKVIIRTSSEYNPPPLTIEPGIPTVISGSDLALFFDPANMYFTGYSRESYIRSKTLPEGAYVISFTAYDFNRRDVALSQGGSMFCYLAKTDPPLLNLPINSAIVRCLNPQNINFHWLSRSTSSPNSAFSTAYRFELFEMRTGGLHPSEIVRNSSPVFTCETDRTTYNYSIADPMLEKGMRYVWRVRSFDRQGGDYIRNDGYSEVFSFLYDDTETPDVSMNFNAIGNFIAEAVSPRIAKLTWDASTEYRTYKVYYREKDKDSRWFEAETDNNNAEVKGLVPGLTYECRVQGKRGNAWGSFSETDTVLMPIPAVIECGSPFEPLNVTNRQPLSMLMKMQQFDAGGFMVTLIDTYAASFSPGRFSGKGFVEVPLFGHKKIACEFTDVFINTDFQMVEGSVRLLKDEKNNLLADLDDIFEGGSDNGKVIDGTEYISNVLPDITITNPDQIVLDAAKNEILIVQSGDTVYIDITDQLKEKGGTVTLKDAKGNIYTVDTRTGKAIEVGRSLPANKIAAGFPATIDSKVGTVIFEMAKDTRFAFDKKDEKYNKANLFQAEYETINLSDGGKYEVPVKLIPAGETDVVQAVLDIKDESIKPDSIMFVSGTGTLYKANQIDKNGEKFLLTLPSGKENDGLEIFATANDKSHNRVLLGKLIVVSYSVKYPKLVLVPVNGNGSGVDIAMIKKELDRVYNPVAVDWNVSVDDSQFTASELNLDVTGSSLFSQYTEGMQALNTSFVEHKKGDFDESAIYLFMLKKADGNITGDMPRSKQFGYIFTETIGKSQEALIRTIAHEIAHGAFHLNHTFDNQYQIPEKKTDNLMDYTDGTILVKHQWDAIHDPGLVIGMFERDEEGASIFGVTWLGNYLWGLAPDKQEKQIEDNLSLFNYTYQNYDKLTSEAKSCDKNLTLTRYTSWSIRQASNQEIAKKVFTGIKENKISYNLWSNGIFFETYTLEGNSYNVLIYSKLKVVNLTNQIRFTSFRSLRNSTIIKIGFTKNYGLIIFYDESGEMQMVVQIISDFDQKKTIIKWVNYLGLIISSEGQKEEDKDQNIGKIISEKEIYDVEKLNEVWDIDEKELLIKYSKSSSQAVKDAIAAVGDVSTPACNVCTRAAFFYITGSTILFPKKGSCLDEFANCNSKNPNFKKGLISNEGSAADIVKDMGEYETNELKKYFVEETRRENETYEDFWKRLQNFAGTGEIIVGTFGDNHVFMLIGGDLYDVINNIERTKDVNEEYKKNPNIDLGDKYGSSFALRNIIKVPRIIECGYKIKEADAPLYANMDYKGGILIKWYRYFKN